MRHLYSSRAEVLRLSGPVINGTPVLAWGRVQSVLDVFLGVPGELMCRIDLHFVRLGKDQPLPIVAGRAPDRTGVMFFDVTDQIKAGDRIRAISGPVVGTFEIRAAPDPAVGYAVAHHMEVQVVEVAQSLQYVFPGSNVGEATS